MNLHMNSKIKIVVLTVVVAVAVLTIFWAIRNQRLLWLEFQDWERWNLTDEQGKEIEQLKNDMSEAGASVREIREAVGLKMDEWGVKRPHPGDIELYYTIKTIISSANAVLLVVLLITYIDLYKRTKSEFTVGLIIFGIALFLYALSSNPLVQRVFGFQAFGLGPFAMLPDLFTFIAVITLLYQTFK